jgi:chorismate mutase / prephenate dehydratase
MDSAAPDPLMAIRRRIDAIDEAMHRLLIERSGVIAELIEIKGTSKPGAAFRPEREADMMRRLVMRHEGALPLVTVEHIWREIITTFTAMQAPFGVAMGPSSDDLAMRDLVRFYFGFSVPVAEVLTSAAAIARVAQSGNDVAVVAADLGERWWAGLAGARAPKVFAKLPFIEMPSRPADLSAYVVGPPLSEANAPDICLFALGDQAGLGAAVVSLGGRSVGKAEGDALIELPVAATLDDLEKEMARPLRDVREVGGFAQPIHFLADRIA